jgi:hypothetical protein
MPSVPAKGDYLLLRGRAQQEDDIGHRSHIVRRTWWYLETIDDNNTRLADVVLEVELAEGGLDSRNHKKHLAMYVARGKKPEQLDDSAY